MNHQAFSKIWIIIAATILVVLVAGGFLAWRQWWQAKKGIKESSGSGYDIYRKSTAKGYAEKGIYYKGKFLKPGYYELEDYCYIDDPGNPSLKGNSLKEYVVINGKLSFGDRTCNCVDGACVKPPAVTKCTETDGGKDIYTKGKVIGIYETEDFISEFEDECSEDGSMLLEGFCTTGMNYDYHWIPCKGGCEDGKCLKGTPSFLPANWPVGKCYDSDGGQNYYVKGETYGDYDGDVYNVPVVGKDRCAGGNQLNEFFCKDDKHSSAIGVRCPCVNGACVRK